MERTNKWDAIILDNLREHNIEVKILQEGFYAVNRTSCHCATICRNLHEWDIIPLVKEIAVQSLPETAYVTWAGKTDDDWFLEVCERTPK